MKSGWNLGNLRRINRFRNFKAIALAMIMKQFRKILIKTIKQENKCNQEIIHSNLELLKFIIE